MTKPVVKKSFKMIEGAKAIDTAIKSIATRGKKFEADIHQAAVSVLVHADKHGDITLAQKLIEAVPNLARKNALREWLMAFGKFGYDSENKTMTYNGKGSTLVEEAIETPFWVFKPEKDETLFDLNAAIHNLIKRAENAAAKGAKVPAAQLNKLRTLDKVAD